MERKNRRDFDWLSGRFLIQRLYFNAVLNDQESAEMIYKHLKANWSEDAHVKGCQIVSLYKPGPSIL
ncbi:MAG: hypothetical protein HOH33_14595 [Verrucomicrobia bacterium]|jgi:hypothetical protein|nr:hypothetical protein [Verrucomicrobiota bacterium]